MSSEGKLQRYQISIYTALFIGYAAYTYNRKSVSLAMPQLIEEGLDKSEAGNLANLQQFFSLLQNLFCNFALTKVSILIAGLIASSQNFAYAISKFIGGILSDRISSRLLFSSGLLLSGLSTLLFSSSDSITLFTLLWFCNGLAQGAGWPACAKLLRQWYSPAQFGTFWSLLSASANISGTLSPFFTSFIILNYGWRFSLMIAGSVSILIGVVAFVSVIDSPAKIGLKSFAESAKKDTDKKKKAKEEETVKDLLLSSLLWLLAFCYFSVFCGKTSAVDWGQLYLMEDRKQSQFVGSAFTSSLELGKINMYKNFMTVSNIFQFFIFAQK